MEASLIGTTSSKKDAPIVLYKSVSFDLPDEISLTFEELKLSVQVENLRDYNAGSKGFDSIRGEVLTKKKTLFGKEEDNCSFSALAKLAALRVMVSTVQEEAVSELLKDVEASKDDVIAVAISDPGVWLFSRQWDERQTFFSISDSFALSQKTGLNVVDSLISDDAALGRQSLLLFPYWILLGDSERGKLIVDLGDSARCFFIPPSKNNFELKSKLFFNNIVPCGSLLDVLTKQATKGESNVDVGGRLSVQGRCNTELLEFWHEGVDERFENGETLCDVFVPALKTLNETYYLDRLVKFNQKVSSVDALCSAVYMISERIIESVRGMEPSFVDQSYDVVLTGAAKLNGLMFSRLSAALAPQGVHSLNEYGSFNEDSFDSVALAVLGLLFAVGTPALLYENNSIKSMMIGRITYGSEGTRRKMTSFLEL
ncbi:MAG: anhydro-N-acetylmuramic acid kinase [Thermoguttaceae bacterium]|nr:anhydro-N-acetylmuramic acid kinase [Thermoguttaceae bacterium]